LESFFLKKGKENRFDRLPLKLVAILNMFLKPNFPHFYSILQFWDMGYGFELPDLYKTGYAVLALSIVTGLALAAM
jgi:hypothetical protein